MRNRAELWIISAILSVLGCSAGATGEAPQQRTPRASATSDVDPYNVTPPGHAGSSFSAAGKGGAPEPLGGGSGNESAGGAGTSAGMAGGTGGLGPNAGALSGSGGAAPHGDSTEDCPSPTRARLAGGGCVERMSEFAVATRPTGIVVGSDGKLWFDDGTVEQLVQLETDGRVLDRWSVPVGTVEREVVAGGGDVLIWFTDPSEKRIWNRTKANVVQPFQLDFAPRGLAVKADGSVWLTELNRAVYLADTVRGTLTNWPAAPSNTIVVGPDGNLWFPSTAGVLSRLSNDGERRDFSISDGVADDLVSGPDGAIWFVDGTHHRIGRLDVDGTELRTYDLPLDSRPWRIITGPDRALWFTEQGTDEIGRITLQGDVSNYPIPTKGGVPWAITVGPDRNLWFTENSSGKVGRLIPDSVE